MLYSAVIHPSPEPFKKGGTFSSIEAVHNTLVSPTSINTEPSAYLVKFLVILTGLICSFFLPLLLIQYLLTLLYFQNTNYKNSILVILSFINMDYI